MYCALSGNIPKDPVVSVKSGHLFDRSLIEKELAINGNKCPETGEALTVSDLLPLKTGAFVTPLPPTKSSVPHVLDHVRAEWDRLNLELHRAQRLLHETRQELATVLYRCDASARLIAKLEKERDELRLERKTAKTANGTATDTASESLGNVEGKKSGGRASDEIADPKAGKKQIEKVSEAQNQPQEKSEVSTKKVADGLVEQAQKLAEVLQNRRKSRKSGAPGSNVVSEFKEIGVATVDGKGVEIAALVINKERMFVGGSSGNIHVVDKDMKVTHSETGHSKGVYALHWKERLFSGGGDGVVKVWDEELKWRATFDDNKDAVMDLQRHPMGTLLFCCRRRGFEWRNVADGVVVGGANADALCGALHPDGLLFAIGGGDGIDLWELSSMKKVAALPMSRVRLVAMSEKGYYLIAGGSDAVVVWDLRKQTVVGRIDAPEACGLALDEFGEFACAVAARGATVFAAKKKARVVTTLGWSGIDGRLGVAWAPRGEFLALGGCDGTVGKFGVAPA